MSLYDEITRVDFNDIGSWQPRVKLFFSAVLGFMLIGAGYNWIIKPKQEELIVARNTEEQLKVTFMEKKALAINLKAYKAQMIEAEETFGVLVKQLPNESEIPDLLIDITQAGLSRGLQFEQIKPGNIITKDFYAEKLVNITVNGEYHQIASFISDIAMLPRIINVDNFKLTRRSDSNVLSLQAVTKTYHYLDHSYIEQHSDG